MTEPDKVAERAPAGAAALLQLQRTVAEGAGRRGEVFTARGYEVRTAPSSSPIRSTRRDSPSSR